MFLLLAGLHYRISASFARTGFWRNVGERAASNLLAHHVFCCELNDFNQFASGGILVRLEIVEDCASRVRKSYETWDNPLETLNYFTHCSISKYIHMIYYPFIQAPTIPAVEELFINWKGIAVSHACIMAHAVESKMPKIKQESSRVSSMLQHVV